MLHPKNPYEEQFKQDVLKGLSQPKKAIASKYLYDDYGSQLFNQITRHPDYYLTNCEVEILELHKANILSQIQYQQFNLIELGPGEGIKTFTLLEYFLQEHHAVTYIPVDISKKYLQTFNNGLLSHEKKLKILPIEADYTEGFDFLKKYQTHPNVVMFLGSSIGNFDLCHAKKFLRNLQHNLQKNDFVLIGFDLRKEITLLLKAYDDTAGLTKAFNLNLLHRINQELGGRFDLTRFRHYPTYNVYTGAMESYLISLCKQSVEIEALGQVFNFAAFEPIHVECSYKYLSSQIVSLAEQAGFEVIAQYQDSKQYFVNSLWRVK